MSRRRLIFHLVLFVCALALVIAGIYFAGRWLEASRYETESVRGDLSQRFDDQATILYRDEPYVYRKGLQTFLFMGIDKPQGSETVDSNYRNGGQADFLLLMIVDAENKRVSQWQIDRDTMAEITTLGVLGYVSGTRQAQICLSHGFGDGKAQSCELTAEAVQRLLYGVPVDYYLAIPFDAIGALNDAVGGVTVEIEDDLSMLDPDMVPGRTLTLNGQQAETFVRARMSVGDGTNVSRMRRQRAYMAGLAQQVDAMVSGNPNAVGNLFDAMGDVMITNLKRGRMINEVNKMVGYQRESVLSLPGTHTTDERGFVEFHVDGDALEQLVIETFYQKAP